MCNGNNTLTARDILQGIARLHSRTVARLHGRMGAWLHSCTVARLHGHTVACSHSCILALSHACTLALLHTCTVALSHARTVAHLHCCTVAHLHSRTCSRSNLLSGLFNNTHSLHVSHPTKMPVVSSKARVPSAPKTPPSEVGVASPTNASPAVKSVALFPSLPTVRRPIMSVLAVFTSRLAIPATWLERPSPGI